MLGSGMVCQVRHGTVGKGKAMGGKVWQAWIGKARYGVA